VKGLKAWKTCANKYDYNNAVNYECVKEQSNKSQKVPLVRFEPAVFGVRSLLDGTAPL